MTIWLVHGWNVVDKGAGTIAKLAPYLEGEEEVRVLGHDWSWSMTANLLMRGCRSRRVAEELLKECQYGDVFVGHSNGCWISYLAAEMGARPRQYVFFNPALRKNREFQECLERVDIFHAPNDKALMVGKWYRRFNPFHSVWGEMGRVGYQGVDPRVLNHNMGNIGHSGVFKKIEYWGPMVRNVINYFAVPPIDWPDR